MNAQELLKQIKLNNAAKLTSRAILRNKSLTEMDNSELSDYIYSQISDWPVRLSHSEKEALFNLMAGAAVWAKQSEYTSEQLTQMHRDAKQKRAERTRLEAEARKPRLMSIEVCV